MRRVAIYFFTIAVSLLLFAFKTQAQDIPIASVGPMTGQYAAFGIQMKHGAEMAVEDINAKGGVLGKKLKLEIGDDACDPKQAVAVANQMVNKGVVFINGHFCSGSSIPASKVYVEEGIVEISPASTNPAFTDEGASNIFRLCGRDDQQGRVAGEFLAKHYSDKNIAILHDKTAYGKGLADETKKTLNEKGKKEETLFEAITAGEKDYSALVSRLKKENIALVYLGGYHTEAGLIVRQMREQGMSTILAAGDALMTDEYWSITGDAGQGTLMTFSPDPRKNPAAADIVKRFREKGIEPEGYVLYSYGAVEAWKQAVEKAGTTDVDAVSKALHGKNTFDTVLGKVSFDKKGDVNAPGYVFYEWKDGKYDYYDK
ncbi:Leu/Ile/Val-binding protein [Candidatus Magnetoovum chiemensis]|nr:Leu/Ile/Val-binding protein [Candidatus Magnetoovum chiemensis]